MQASSLSSEHQLQEWHLAAPALHLPHIAGDAGPQEGQGEDLSNTGACARLQLQHSMDERPQLVAVDGRDWVKLALEDLAHQPCQAAGLKGMLLRAELIDDAANAPDVTLVVVRLALTDLWAEVIGGAHNCLGALHGVLQHSGNACKERGDRGKRGGSEIGRVDGRGC